MSEPIRVVGAVIVRDGRVLCAQRGPDKKLPGLWEFPGGKIEVGETSRQALQREISEELGCAISVGGHIDTTVHQYEFGRIELSTYWCSLIDAGPAVTEHSDLRWLAYDELRVLDWAPADLPAVAKVSAELGKNVG